MAETQEKKNQVKGLEVNAVKERKYIPLKELTNKDVKSFPVYQSVFEKIVNSKTGRSYAFIKLSIHDELMSDLEIRFDDIHEYNLFRLKLELPLVDEKGRPKMKNTVPCFVRFVKGPGINQTTNEEYEYVAVDLIFSPEIMKRHYFSKSSKGLLLELEEKGKIKIDWHRAEKVMSDVEELIPEFK